MIRLRTFVILSSLLVVILVLVVSWTQMKGALDKGAQTLREREMENIAQVARSAIDTKKNELKNYTRVIRNNNDLASAYLLARESGDTKLIDTKLRKIKEEVSFDFAEILTLKGAPIHSGNFGLSPATLAKILVQKEGLFPAALFGEPALLSFSPLKLYEEPIGIVVMGYFLQRHVGKSLSMFTGADISFKMEPGDEKISTKIRLTDTSTESFWSILSWRLVVAGVASLALLQLALYCFLELGFISQFRGFVEEMNKAAQDIDRGEPRELPTLKSRIFENNLLYGASQALVKSLIAYQSRTKRQVQIEEEGRKQKALGEMAQQVAHDIRSPLSALVAATDSLAELPEANRVLIRSAVSRIQDITNELISKRADREKDPRGKEVSSVQLLSDLVETILSEKRMQLRSRFDIQVEAKLDDSSYWLFGNVQPAIFKTILSNLLNNSVEAMPHGGRAFVYLKEIDGRLEITVEDNGAGIPKEYLPLLGQRGKSFNKTDGSGLGLYHARTNLEAWGGSLTVESTEGVGTRVKMVLPKAKPPKWFVSNIPVRANQPVIIVDDDLNIHQIWESRFRNVKNVLNVTMKHFSTLEQLADWKKNDGDASALCLVDYEFLGDDNNGLAQIESLGIESQSILVTSRYEDPAIVAGCLAKNIGLVPKGMAGFIPIVEAV